MKTHVLARLSLFVTLLISMVQAQTPTLTPDPLDLAPGESDTMTVTLDSVAPPGGILVALAIDPAIAIIPSQLFVAPGALQATFTVTAHVTGSANITASIGGYWDTATVNVFESDSDNDGINDALEVSIFGNTTTANATSDFDSDTLLDIDEINTHNTSPLLADTDGDTIDDAVELAHAGLNPNRDDSVIISSVVNAIQGSPALQRDFNLYPESAVRNVFLDAPLISVDTEAGEVHLSLTLQVSDDLSIWTPLGDPVQWTDTVVDDKAFYRVFVNVPTTP